MKEKYSLYLKEHWDSETQKRVKRYYLLIKNSGIEIFLFGKWSYNGEVYWLNKKEGIKYIEKHYGTYVELEDNK